LDFESKLNAVPLIVPDRLFNRGCRSRWRRPNDAGCHRRRFATIAFSVGLVSARPPPRHQHVTGRHPEGAGPFRCTDLPTVLLHATIQWSSKTTWPSPEETPVPIKLSAVSAHDFAKALAIAATTLEHSVADRGEVLLGWRQAWRDVPRSGGSRQGQARFARRRSHETAPLDSSLRFAAFALMAGKPRLAGPPTTSH